jgi:hypothetical protein
VLLLRGGGRRRVEWRGASKEGRGEADESETCDDERRESRGRS